VSRNPNSTLHARIFRKPISKVQPFNKILTSELLVKNGLCGTTRRSWEGRKTSHKSSFSGRAWLSPADPPQTTISGRLQQFVKVVFREKSFIAQSLKILPADLHDSAVQSLTLHVSRSARGVTVVKSASSLHAKPAIFIPVDLSIIIPSGRPYLLTAKN